MQAAKADKSGAFGPRTELVTLQFGLNDHWGRSQQTLWKSLQNCVFNLVDGCGPEAVEQGRMPDYNAVTGELFADCLRNAVTYIRYYAPVNYKMSVLLLAPMTAVVATLAARDRTEFAVSTPIRAWYGWATSPTPST